MTALLWAATALLSLSCSIDVTPFPGSRTEGKVGLDVNILDGAGQAISLLPADGFYINQLRLEYSVRNFPVPDVVDWLETESPASFLDWTGLATVIGEAEVSRGIWSEYRGLLNAAWMEEPQSFEISIYDDGGTRLAGPIAVDPDDYVLSRHTAFSWIANEPGKGNYGGNAGSYSNLTVASAGDFTGPADDIYDVVVTTGGPLDGTARVSVSSVRGDDLDEFAVISGYPIDLGSAGRGASITFTDAGGTELVAGDHWTVRCTAGDEPAVGPATPGVKAKFHALAQIRLQFPHEHGIDNFAIPSNAAEMRVTWSARPDQPYVVPLSFAEPTDPPQPGYGLQVELTATPPTNGSYYRPGESFELTVNLFDGDGNRLNDPETLPTYRDFMTGKSNGLQYYNLTVDPSLTFFTEHRLNLMRLAVFGPKQDIDQNYTDQPSEDYFEEEVNLPDVSTVVIAGLKPGSDAWDTEIPNHAEFTIPEDADSGTYVALAKVARTYHGQSIYREEHIELQVGSNEVTEFDRDVGNCTVCHTADAELSRLRHGISTDTPKFCQACHVPPHADPIGVVVHRIHFFSSKYPVRKSGCALCHLKPDSNTRASIALCGACHGTIHPGEDLEFSSDPYVQCGETCHKQLPAIHVISTPGF